MIYIAPPFGTYFRPRGTIPVLGSFTLQPRPGRTGQILRTLRPVPGGWVNTIGLRNTGIDGLTYKPDVVYSLAGINDGDWEAMLDRVRSFGWSTHRIELNLSCPNVHEYGTPRLPTLDAYARLRGAQIIAKLSPYLGDSFAMTELCLSAGIRLIHLSNTLPSPIGGISGTVLRKVNLPLVERVARHWSQARIIAGGGIYTIEHARQYRDAGAIHLSLGTVFMNPVRGWRLAHQIRREFRL